MTQATAGNELAKKMASILGEVGRVPKNGRNNFQKYDYATESDVLDTIRPILAKYGIAVFYNCLEVIDLENARVRVKVEFELVDGDSGAAKTTICFGEARDADSQGRPQDKGIYKAMTGACKYWLFKTFLISTGDDPEHESPEKNTAHSKSSKQKPAKPAAKDSKAEVIQELKATRTAYNWTQAQCLDWLKCSVKDASVDQIRELIEHIVASDVAKGVAEPASPDYEGDVVSLY